MVADAFLAVGANYPLETRGAGIYDSYPFTAPRVAEMANPEKYSDKFTWSRMESDVQIGTVVIWYDPGKGSHHMGIVSYRAGGNWQVTSANYRGLSTKSLLEITRQQGVAPIFRNYIGK
jgi:hypothetical protein